MYINMCFSDTIDIFDHITDIHDYVHQMETFSALLALCVRNSLVTGEFPTQRPVTQSVDVLLCFVLICSGINGQVNNREAGDLGRPRAHYDVIVMSWTFRYV